MTRVFAPEPRSPLPATRAVYVAAMNRRTMLAALGDAVTRDPYRAAPVAPVLHLKPANTWIGPGDPIPCPREVPGLRMGGTLGLVIGRTASRVSAGRALAHVGGWIIANDVSVPYESHYRPAIRQRCRDGFCPIGPVHAPESVADPERLEVVIEVDGRIVTRADGTDLVRGAAALLADVSQFITFEPGDLLLLGEPHDAPLAAPGSTVRILIEGLGSLTNPVRWEELP